MEHFSSIEIMKNSKLLNHVLSKSLPCVSFLYLLLAFIAYYRTLDDFYAVTFPGTRLIDIQQYILSANFIPGVQDNTYNPYIHVARFFKCVSKLLKLILYLNLRFPLPSCKMTKAITARNLTDKQLFDFSKHDLLLCAEGGRYALNTQPVKGTDRRTDLAFYGNNTECLKRLKCIM